MLIKPTKRDLIKAATEKAKQDLHQRSMDLHKQAQDIHDQVRLLQSEDAEKTRESAQADPLEDSINDCLTEFGFGRCAKITVCSTPGEPVVLRLNASSEKRAKAKRHSNPQIKGFIDEAARLYEEALYLTALSRSITEEDVLKGSINQALDGKAAEALQVLADSISAVALQDEATLEAAKKLIDRRKQRYA